MGFVAAIIAIVLKLSILSFVWATPEDHYSFKTTPLAFQSAIKAGVSPQVLKLALEAYNWVDRQGLIKKPVLTIVDYTKPSYQKRLWVIDMKTQNVLFNGLVAHGKNSGLNQATAFSNEPGSDESSPGVYLTDKAYEGKHGLSLRIDGLEKGINDNARKRSIVVHPAQYVTPHFAQLHGHAGRSWGCFALNPKFSQSVIHMIKDGSVIFAYAPVELNDPFFAQ